MPPWRLDGARHLEFRRQPRRGPLLSPAYSSREGGRCFRQPRARAATCLSQVAPQIFAMRGAASILASHFCAALLALLFQLGSTVPLGSVIVGKASAVASPVVIVPGDGSNQLEARWNKPSTPHVFCRRISAPPSNSPLPSAPPCEHERESITLRARHVPVISCAASLLTGSGCGFQRHSCCLGYRLPESSKQACAWRLIARIKTTASYLHAQLCDNPLRAQSPSEKMACQGRVPFRVGLDR
jgi:hypothetical protein